MAKLTPDQLRELQKLVNDINSVIVNTSPAVSDAIIAIALMEQLAYVTMLRTAGEVAFEGRDLQSAWHDNTTSIRNMFNTALEIEETKLEARIKALMPTRH